MAKELHTVCATRLQTLMDANLFEMVREVNIIAAIREGIEVLAEEECRHKLSEDLKAVYKPIFEVIPHVDNLPTDVLCEIKIKDAYKTLSKRSYQCPRKYKEAWHELIQKHLYAGRIRPLNSPFASPAFLIPKTDKTALPRWVNDINSNTVHDVFPLPRVDDILADCAKGKIWSTIDFTDSFFQTRLHPDSIPYTAVSMPLGLYKWLVMPQGLRYNSAMSPRHCVNTLARSAIYTSMTLPFGRRTKQSTRTMSASFLTHSKRIRYIATQRRLSCFATRLPSSDIAFPSAASRRTRAKSKEL
jgi:hypothetical protein